MHTQNKAYCTVRGHMTYMYNEATEECVITWLLVELGEKGHNLQILTSFFIHRVGENKTLSACVCVCACVCERGGGWGPCKWERDTQAESRQRQSLQKQDRGSHYGSNWRVREWRCCTERQQRNSISHCGGKSICTVWGREGVTQDRVKTKLPFV